MTSTKICAYCQLKFAPFRSDVKFCSPSCRYKYAHRKRLYDKALEDQKSKIEQLQDTLLGLNEQMQEYERVKKKQKAQDALDQSKDDKIIAAYENVLQASDKTIYQWIAKKEIDSESDPGQRSYLKDYFQYVDASVKQEIVADYRSKKKAKLEALKIRQMERLLRYPIFGEDPTIKAFKDEIIALEQKLTDLKQTKITLDLPTSLLDQVSDHPKGISKKDKQARIAAMQDRKQGRALTGAEVRNMHFETLTLLGELGEFLGALDRNMVAFALTGDSGAGKSYFSYQLAKLFLDNNLRVKYYSLEEGVGQLTKDKLDYFGIGRELLVTDYASLDDIDREAGKYDVIIIDSYSKISKDPEDYEILRQTHSQTLFVVIFQKTTGKTIRGGASITFNSSAIIDIQKQGDERIAVMQKSRYGTANWIYSIDEQKIISKG